MACTCVVGMQWGDEGKGKIVDWLSRDAEIVVRYGGGANAGHTVRVAEKRFAFRLIPSGIIHPHITCVIANGVVVDPATVLEELKMLAEAGIAELGPERLKISTKAHVVMPYHKLADKLSEQRLSAGEKIGTTARGIGPCYSDKYNRSTAVRMVDFFHPDSFRRKLSRIVAEKNAIFAALYDAEPLDADAIADEYLRYAGQLRPYIVDTTRFLLDAISAGRRILFEGANGSLLDIDHGTFPFVTSSNASVLGLPAGAGVPPRCIDKIVGVIKAYNSRVGTGPFPTELDDRVGQYLRDRGREYGTVTGRPRRTGWFDAVATAYAVRLGGVDELAITLLDVLSGLEKLNICVAYRYNGRLIDYFPDDVTVLDQVEPVFETLDGWSESLQDVRSFEQLPSAARDYIRRLEQLLAAPVRTISVGPERQQTIVR